MLKEITDDVTKAMEDLRKNNAPTYWATLTFIGAVLSGLVFLLLKTTGIIILIGVAFALIVNNLAIAYREARKAHQAVLEAAQKVRERVAKASMVGEAEKPTEIRVKPVRINR